jgi:hypothetical protein
MTPISRKCTACNNMMPEDASFCPVCGHDFRPLAESRPRVRRTPMPLLAGGLIMVSGLSQLIVALELLVVYVGEVPSLQDENAVIIISAVSMMMIGPLAVAGGYYALRRTRFAWALIGGVLTSSVAILTTIYGTGTLIALGLLATILLVGSKDEFDEL